MKLFYRNIYAVGVTSWVCADARESERDRLKYLGYGYLGREIVALGRMRDRPVVVEWEPAQWPKDLERLRERQLQCLLARRNDRV